MRLLILVAIIFISFLTSNIAAAETTPPGVSEDSSNFLGGIVHGQYTHELTSKSAGSVAVEAGPRNYRASATVGLAINPQNRVKLTGEYLTQNIDYNFYSGVTRQWTQQGAIGANYQFALNDHLQNYLFLQGFYSYAPSKSLSNREGTFPDGTGDTLLWTNLRRIAGSNAFGFNPGMTSHPWRGAETNISLNYDSVIYDNTYESQVKARGFGATGSITQALNPHFQVGASAAFRAPFNYYEAKADWIRPLATSQLLVGVFCGYTVGKQTLPSTSLMGVNLTYAIDAPTTRLMTDPHQPQSFISWVAQPAVKLPQVLAIKDEAILTSNCFDPSLNGTISDLLILIGVPASIPTAYAFNANGRTLTFSASNLPTGLTINPRSGIITGTPTNAIEFPVAVTASSKCGSATQTFNITVLEIN